MEGDQTEVEFDMLDVEAQPQNARQLSEEGRKMLRENLWDVQLLIRFLMLLPTH